jgi:hypothetical protein
MPQSSASVLGLIYVFSELGLALKKRAKAGETRILSGTLHTLVL